MHRDTISLAVVIGLIVIIACGICRFGYCWGRDIEREAALQAGAAHYVVNPKTGRTVYLYKGE
jgi:hypothetical protein